MSLLKKLCTCIAPSGYEMQMRELIKKELKPYADEVREDALGNIIAEKKGKGKKILFSAPMDEAGVFVTTSPSEGKWQFHTIGELRTDALSGRWITFADGEEGIAVPSKDKMPESVEEMVIEISEKRDETLTSMAGALSPDYRETDDVIRCKAVGSRACCYILLELAKTLSSYTMVFTAQSVSGAKGAATAAQQVEADEIIFLNSMPSDKKEVGILVKDKSVISTPKLYDSLFAVAEKHEIKAFSAISERRSDGGMFRRYCTQSEICGIVLPVNQIGTAVETVDRSVISHAEKLLKKYAKGAEKK